MTEIRAGRFIPTCVGNSSWHRCSRQCKRFIPTCVGNSYVDPAQSSPLTVHPHMRGELSIGRILDRPAQGSSPHAWGTRFWFNPDQAIERFIPTCVGNSYADAVGAAAQTVHPHMRGELLDATTVAQAIRGSSPHAWGTLAEKFSPIPLLRFIPTCVGNSPGPWVIGPGRTVHPHMRGELSSRFWR